MVDEIKTELDEDDAMDLDEHPSMNHSMDSEPPMDAEEAEPIPELGPAALGLQRVGTQPPAKPNPPTQPVQVLNRRGMPARIRKKNKLFYDDVLINHPHHRYIFLYTGKSELVMIARMLMNSIDFPTNRMLHPVGSRRIH